MFRKYANAVGGEIEALVADGSTMVAELTTKVPGLYFDYLGSCIQVPTKEGMVNAKAGDVITRDGKIFKVQPPSALEGYEPVA